MRRTIPVAAAALAFATIGHSAEAYIGPGAGISLLGAFWALIMAVVAAVGFVVWYPLRRMFRRQPAPTRRPAGAVDSRHRTEPDGETRPI